MNNTRKRLLAIINPISGTHSKVNIPDTIKMTLDESIYDIQIKFTEYAGHATVITKEAVDNKIDYVLSVGGGWNL